MINKKKVLLIITAAALAAAMSIAPAMAYFSTHSGATGIARVRLGDTTTIVEPNIDLTTFTKTLVVTNEGPESCYVREIAFAPTNLILSYSGIGWTAGADGYYYYGTILGEGDSTAELYVDIDNVPEDAEAGDTFNVAVVYESAKVLYDEAGNPLPADWDMTPIVDEGGEE